MYPVNNDTPARFTPYTGIDVFKPVAVNPTLSQLKDMGINANIEPDYSIKKDYNQIDVRPLVFYFRGIGANQIGQIRIDISTTPYIMSTGNWQVLTSTGQIITAKTKEGDLKAELANHRQLGVGEAELITLIQKMIGFRKTDGYDFMAVATANKQTVQDAFSGDYSGFQALIDWCVENQKTIVTGWSVRETQTPGKYAPQIWVKRGQFNRTIFSGDPNGKNEWAIGALTQNLTNDESLVRGFYTIKLQPFNLEDCVNNLPATPKDQEAPW